MIERYVALAHPAAEMTGTGCLTDLPKPRLNIDSDTQSATLDKFGLNTSNRPVLGLCPGAEFGPAKRWPEQHFTAVAKEMIEGGYQVWLFGSAKDQDVTNAIKSALPEQIQEHCVNLAGATSLIEAVDLLAACESVVSNDSGLMHVSAAVGCNIVALYGSTSPGYTPPLADKVAILHTDIGCRPCFKRECPLGHLKCLTELSPQRVVSSLKQLAAQEANA